MLQFPLLQPEILESLGSAGHGSRVLIADGNYPFTTGTNPSARKVYLNLAPDMLKVTDVLEVLVKAIPIEAAHVMVPDDGSEPAIFAEFRKIMPEPGLETLDRFAFYDQSKTADVALVIATGERRIYANILLTIGVVAPN